MPRIKAPVYGFYGGNDARIDATLPDAREQMKTAGKTFDPVVYDGAGHGFMRAGEAPDANDANRKARSDAWERWKHLLGRGCNRRGTGCAGEHRAEPQPSVAQGKVRDQRYPWLFLEIDPGRHEDQQNRDDPKPDLAFTLFSHAKMLAEDYVAVKCIVGPISYPSQERTGRRGYLANRLSVTASWQRRNCEPRSDSMRRACVQSPHRPGFG